MPGKDIYVKHQLQMEAACMSSTRDNKVSHMIPKSRTVVAHDRHQKEVGDEILRDV